MELGFLDSWLFQDDFADNREFIALLVYDTGGKKVFYPCKYQVSESIDKVGI